MSPTCKAYQADHALQLSKVCGNAKSYFDVVPKKRKEITRLFVEQCSTPKPRRPLPQLSFAWIVEKCYSVVQKASLTAGDSAGLHTRAS